MIGVTFRCGHSQKVDPDKTPSPQCATCGDRQVARVSNAPAPRFVGHVRGPSAQTRRMEPIAVRVAKAGPLPLKAESAHGE